MSEKQLGSDVGPSGNLLARCVVSTKAVATFVSRRDKVYGPNDNLYVSRRRRQSQKSTRDVERVTPDAV